MWTYNQNTLSHHGVKGMKWGVRRAKRKAARAQRRAIKKYNKYTEKIFAEVDGNYEKRYVEAYNKTADEYNNGKIEAYNKKHNHKTDKDYYTRYEEQFDRDFDINLRKMTISEIENNVNYKKAQALVDEYGLVKIHDLAKENAEYIAKEKRALGL